MDLYSPPVLIKYSLKISEETLKTEFGNQREILTEAVNMQMPEFPDLKYRIGVKANTVINENGEAKEMFELYLTVKRIDQKTIICSNFVYYVKSANFIDYCNEFYTWEEDTWGDHICSLTDLYDAEKKFIVDGELIIEVKGLLFVKNAMKNENAESYLTKRLWSDEDEKDFLIVGGKENERKIECKVHKCILSAYSPVFKRMFKTDMKEMREGKVEITDFDADIVEIAIKFCYDQESCEDEEWQTLIDIHKFADKYDMEKLKREAEFYLVTEISFENICEVTNAVIDLNAPEILDFCLHCLFLALREGIPVKDMQILDKNFAIDLLTKVSSLEYS